MVSVFLQLDLTWYVLSREDQHGYRTRRVMDYEVWNEMPAEPAIARIHHAAGSEVGVDRGALEHTIQCGGWNRIAGEPGLRLLFDVFDHLSRQCVTREPKPGERSERNCAHDARSQGETSGRQRLRAREWQLRRRRHVD